MQFLSTVRVFFQQKLINFQMFWDVLQHYLIAEFHFLPKMLGEWLQLKICSDSSVTATISRSGGDAVAHDLATFL